LGIFYAGVYRKMFLENIRSPLVYILSREREKILLVCLQVREDQKEQTFSLRKCWIAGKTIVNGF
jgi:hypothetical protein